MYTELKKKKKTRIKNLFRNSNKNNSILTHSIDQKEIYRNPYKSQQTLNFNHKIYKTINNIRMETKINSYSKRINE